MPNRYGNTIVVSLRSSKSPSQKILKKKYKNTEKKNIENTKQYFESLVIIAQNPSQ